MYKLMSHILQQFYNIFSLLFSICFPLRGINQFERVFTIYAIPLRYINGLWDGTQMNTSCMQKFTLLLRKMYSFFGGNCVAMKT